MSVLFVNISDVAFPINVSDDVGKVSVPVLLIVLITGAASVLLLNVSVPANVANPLVILADGTQFAPVVEVDCNI